MPHLTNFKRPNAVVVATRDHHHAIATMAALKAGKHVYCEKPMAHNVAEVRKMTEAARESGLATQLGTGAHSGYNYRSMVALVKSRDDRRGQRSPLLV